MMINIACFTLIFSGLLAPEQSRRARKPLPPIPSIGLRLVPVTLGYQFVQVEITSAALKRAEAKSDPIANWP